MMVDQLNELLAFDLSLSRFIARPMNSQGVFVDFCLSFWVFIVKALFASFFDLGDNRLLFPFNQQESCPMMSSNLLAL
tara:strand:+ start:101 stop:334 length:234 start_codon:yes stop_codon:yes gene_type:complete